MLLLENTRLHNNEMSTFTSFYAKKKVSENVSAAIDLQRPVVNRLTEEQRWEGKPSSVKQRLLVSFFCVLAAG